MLRDKISDRSDPVLRQEYDMAVAYIQYSTVPRPPGSYAVLLSHERRHRDSRLLAQAVHLQRVDGQQLVDKAQRSAPSGEGGGGGGEGCREA